MQTLVLFAQIIGIWTMDHIVMLWDNGYQLCGDLYFIVHKADCELDILHDMVWLV